METEQVVIVGAGPAGMTAAIQLKRYGIPFVLLERERVGGLLWNANLVENYPGFPSGVSGPKLVRLIEKQMEHIGVEVTFDSVVRLRHDKTNFQVETLRTKYQARYLVIASGTKPNPIPLNISKEARDLVFSDVYHLLNKSNKRIVIIGGGDAAFDYALNLTKNRNSVTILNRGRDVQCLKLLWDRALASSLIEYRPDSPVSQVNYEETAGRLRVRTEAGESSKADYLLFAIGRVPQLDFAPDEIVNSHLERVYFVGDVNNGLFRQAAIAAGEGLRVAMEIHSQINAEASSL